MLSKEACRAYSDVRAAFEMTFAFEFELGRNRTCFYVVLEHREAALVVHADHGAHHFLHPEQEKGKRPIH